MLFYHFILFGGWVHAFFSSWECLFLYSTTFIVLKIRLVHYIKKNSTISFIVLFKNHVNSTEGVRQPMSELFTIFDNFYKI